MNIARALARRIRMLIARSVVSLVNDGLKIQGLQLTVLDGEVAQVQRFQNYGFTSVPLEGAEAICAAVAGVRSHLVAIAVDDGRYRKKDLKPGESAMYTDEGDYILMKRGRIIEVKSGSKVHVEAPTIEAIASTRATVQAPTIEATATVEIKLTAPTITAAGALAVTGGMTVGGTISGPNGAPISGTMEVAGDVKGGGVSLKGHMHPGDSGGTTGKPI